MKDIMSFREQDLHEWCKENNIKVALKIKFITAIKQLPQWKKNQQWLNAQFIYLTEEHKQQISEFQEMFNKTKSIIIKLHEIMNKSLKSNILNAKQTVNHTCDDLTTIIETLRANLLENV